MTLNEGKRILKSCGDYHYHNRKDSLNKESKEAMRIEIVFDILKQMGRDGYYTEMMVIRMRYFDKSKIDTIAFSLNKSRRFVHYKLRDGLSEFSKRLAQIMGRSN